MWAFVKTEVFPSIAAIADSMTIAFYVILLISYFSNREKINFLLNLFITRLKKERLHKLHSILDELEELDYSDKGDRPKILGMLGRIVGHLKTNQTLSKSCESVRIEIEAILEQRTQLNAPTKERLTQEVRGHVENVENALDGEVARAKK